MIVRDDLSNRLIHLTRDADDKLASDKFLEILLARRVNGSRRDIRGGQLCVCLTEAPISKLAMTIAQANQQAFRYRPFGIILTKEWVFSNGGRPVIYQKNDEFDLLPDALKYRHVRFEPGECDYTWEREWRVPTNALLLEPAQTTVVVPTRTWAMKIREGYVAQQQEKLRSLRSSLFGAFPHVDFPWNVIVLEDLGMDFLGEN